MEGVWGLNEEKLREDVLRIEAVWVLALLRVAFAMILLWHFGQARKAPCVVGGEACMQERPGARKERRNERKKDEERVQEGENVSQLCECMGEERVERENICRRLKDVERERERQQRRGKGTEDSGGVASEKKEERSLRSGEGVQKEERKTSRSS